MLEDNIKQKILEEIYRAPNKPKVPKTKPPVRMKAIAAWMAGFLAVSAVVAMGVQQYLEKSTVTYMLPISLKTISKKGFPVAGVQVTIDGKLYGKTDSFGDWQGLVPMDGGAERLAFRLVKKTDKGRYYKALNKAIATDNIAGMPLNFNVALSYKKVARKAKSLSTYADSQVTLTLHELPPGSHRQLEKARNVFAYQTLPQIERKLNNLGITTEQGSRWHVGFEVVAKRSGYPMLKAEQTLRGKKTRFLIHLSKPFHEVARQVIAMLKSTAERSYGFDQQPYGLALHGISRMPEFWWPNVGDRFQSARGRSGAAAGSVVATLSLLDDGRADKVLGLKGESCPNGKRCTFNRLARYHGFARGKDASFNLKVITPDPAQTEVYVNGIGLTRRSGGYYRYHGVPHGKSFVAILFKGAYYGGYRVHHRLKQVPVITVYPSKRPVAARTSSPSARQRKIKSAKPR